MAVKRAMVHTGGTHAAVPVQVDPRPPVNTMAAVHAQVHIGHTPAGGLALSAVQLGSAAPSKGEHAAGTSLGLDTRCTDGAVYDSGLGLSYVSLAQARRRAILWAAQHHCAQPFKS